MQTQFSDDQLNNPRVAEANDILRRCVHCGLCTATCPTYVLLGDERDSPRGRIYLIKDMFENARPADAEVRHHIDRCLTCLSCMTTCPSGVDYMHLVEHARGHIEETAPRGWRDRLVRRVLAGVVPYPGRFRMALVFGALGKPFRGLLRRAGFAPLAAMLDLAPSPLRALRRDRAAKPMPGNSVRRVAMLKGCAQRVLRPEINEATERVLNRLGIAVVAPADAGCCGALVQHMGNEREARNQAMRNVDAWWREMARDGGLEAVIINASGCGTTVKDYGHLLRDYASDIDTERKLIHLTARAKDITEFLATEDLGPPRLFSSIKVAYHAACSMQHGQRITDAPKDLLTKAGYTVSSIAEGHLCCGSAGVYNILQSEIATQLRDRKVANIEMTRPDVIATGNIGCITQIQSGTSLPVVHTVELLDWAYGGPCPTGLEHLEGRVTMVPEGAQADDLLAAAE